MVWSDEILRELKKFGKFFEVVFCINAILRFTELQEIKPFQPASKFTQEVAPPNIVVSLSLLLLAVIVTILMYLFIIPIMCYKFLVITVLRVRYKNNYGGLLRGADVMWLLEKEDCRNIVNYLLLIEFDKSTGGNPLEFAKYVCQKRFFKSERLTSLRISFMGYTFLLKNQLTTDDVVKDMFLPQGIRNTKVFKKILQDYTNKPLPKNDTASWELLVGQEPVKLKGFEDEENLYPFLLRVHHTIADGATTLSLLINHLSDENCSALQTPKSKTWRNEVQNSFGQNSQLIPMLNRADENNWRKTVSSGDKKLGLYVEREAKYMTIVKRIKNKFERAAFTDVILTAISASLDAHFKKNSQFFPDEVTLSFVVTVNKDDLVYVHKNLGNIFSAGSIRLPINLDKCFGAALLDRFREIHEMYEQCNRSHDIWINYYWLHLFMDVFPSPILRHSIKSTDVATIALSNLPGFRKISVCGRSLKHLLFWVPTYQSTGMAISLITYDDRFHMGLVVDKDVISEEEEVQQILEDVFKYIEMMDEQFASTSRSDD